MTAFAAAGLPGVYFHVRSNFEFEVDSEADFDAVCRAVWVPIDLNHATADEIRLIPSVDAGMLHEFEEYRPYRALAEFRREIGKYVDDEELERLARSSLCASMRVSQ